MSKLERSLSVIGFGLGMMLWSTTISAQQAPQPVEQQGPKVELGQPQTAPTSADKAQAKAIKEKISFLLSGYEYFPDRAELDAVGNPALVGAALLSLFHDEAQSVTLRLRALEAMGYYQERWSEELLLGLLKQASTTQDKQQLRFERAVRRRAALGLAKAHGAQSVPTLDALLRSPQEDLQLKMTIVSALGKHGGKPGMLSLERLRRDASADETLRQEALKYVKP